MTIIICWWSSSFSCPVAIIFNSVIVVITEVWSPSRSTGQCCTHDLCWRRGVDGILRGFFHSSLSYWNTGTSARNQHLIAVNAAKHWYTHSSCVHYPANRGLPKFQKITKVPSQNSITNFHLTPNMGLLKIVTKICAVLTDAIDPDTWISRVEKVHFTGHIFVSVM